MPLGHHSLPRPGTICRYSANPNAGPPEELVRKKKLGEPRGIPLKSWENQVNCNNFDFIVRNKSISQISVSYVFVSFRDPCVAGYSSFSMRLHTSGSTPVPELKGVKMRQRAWVWSKSTIWRFLKMGVTLNHPFWEGFQLITNQPLLGTPHLWKPPYGHGYPYFRKSSIFEGFSSINHPFCGTPIYEHLHISPVPRC